MKSRPQTPTVRKLVEGSYAALTNPLDGNSEFGGRPYYLLISPLVYEINGARVKIPPGLVTDRATVCLYALRSVLNRLGMWRTVMSPAALHDWLPSKRYSDKIFRQALCWEWRRLTGRRKLVAWTQRWVMYWALAITFPLRGWFAKPPSPTVMAAAGAECARRAAPYSPYTTHNT